MCVVPNSTVVVIALMKAIYDIAKLLFKYWFAFISILNWITKLNKTIQLAFVYKEKKWNKFIVTKTVDIGFCNNLWALDNKFCLLRLSVLCKFWIEKQFRFLLPPTKRTNLRNKFWLPKWQLWQLGFRKTENRLRRSEIQTLLKIPFRFP